MTDALIQDETRKPSWRVKRNAIWPACEDDPPCDAQRNDANGETDIEDRVKHTNSKYTHCRRSLEIPGALDCGLIFDRRRGAAKSLRHSSLKEPAVERDGLQVLVGHVSLREMVVSENRIVSNPGILGGKPCIRGTRISVEYILELIASGATTTDVVKAYPGVSAEDVAAAVRYAAGLLRGASAVELELSR